MDEPDFKVGDVISMRGAGVPRELEDKFFRVEDITEEGPRLSPPFEDQQCTRRYYSEAAQRLSPEYRKWVQRQRMHENW